MHVFRMSLGWQLCLCSIPVLGCAAMMVGIAPSLLFDEAPSEPERLGPESPARATLAGLRFED
ncbi:MAG: hypothetical protein ACE37K_03420 [Planctomycetota bacterium]